MILNFWKKVKHKNQLARWHRGGWDSPQSVQYYVQDQKSKRMATKIFSLTPSEQQAKWDDIMGQMCTFVDDTNADIDMAYDWVCEMLNIDSFVDNETAWNSFYSTWETCDNRNDLSTFQIVWFSTFFHHDNHRTQSETLRSSQETWSKENGTCMDWNWDHGSQLRIWSPECWSLWGNVWWEKYSLGPSWRLNDTSTLDDSNQYCHSLSIHHSQRT